MQAGRPLSSLCWGCLDRLAESKLGASQGNSGPYTQRALWQDNWHWSGYKLGVPGLSAHRMPTRSGCRWGTVQARSSLEFHAGGALAVLLKLRWIWGSVVPGIFIQNVPCKSSWSWIWCSLYVPRYSAQWVPWPGNWNHDWCGKVCSGVKAETNATLG